MINQWEDTPNVGFELRSPCGPAVSRERLEKGEVSVNHDSVLRGQSTNNNRRQSKAGRLTTGTHVRNQFDVQSGPAKLDIALPCRGLGLAMWDGGNVSALAAIATAKLDAASNHGTACAACSE